MFPAIKGAQDSGILRSVIEPGQPLQGFGGAGFDPDAYRRARQLRSLSPSVRRLQAIRNAISVPGSKFDYSQLTSMRIQLRQTLQDAVGRVMGQTTIIRDLAIYDLTGVAAGTALYARLQNKQATVARTWLVNDLGFRVVPVNTAIAIFGFIQMASIPLLDGIAFTQGGVITLAQFWLHHIYADQLSSIGYFDPPIIWKPQQSVGINLVSETAISAGVENYGLIGAVAEPAANTVAPDQANLV
jgi:hypothetical protein